MLTILVAFDEQKFHYDSNIVYPEHHSNIQLMKPAQNKVLETWQIRYPLHWEKLIGKY